MTQEYPTHPALLANAAVRENWSGFRLRARQAVNEIECQPYRVVVHADGESGAYLQVHGFEPDAVTGEPAPAEGHGGRKWRLSLHMTRSEIVQTALKAILTYAEHEIRERFTWRGARIFGPHISVEALFKVCDELDGRT